MKTKIEWCGYTINPVKGLCPMACSYCYARRMYKRFKWNPEIRFEYADSLRAILSIRRPSKIFVGSTMELFGDWIHLSWGNKMFREIPLMFPQHTFIFLTKQPQNLLAWSPFPSNCHIGVSVTSNGDMTRALTNLAHTQATVKFLSIEPLLGMIGMNDHMPLEQAGIGWIIIGQQTPVKKATMPSINWIQEILVAAHNAGDLPVFIKDNLKPLIEKEWPGWPILQEFPSRSNQGNKG